MHNSWELLRSYAAARWSHKLTDRLSVERFQETSLIRHSEFLRRSSKYFSQCTPVKTMEDFYTWPVMDKAIMMKYFDDMNTAGLSLEIALDTALKSEKTRDFSPTYQGYSVGLSSGTSGHRGIFVVSAQEQAAWAGNVLAKFLPKRNVLKHRVAFFLRANNRLYESVQSRFLSFQYFDMYDPFPTLLTDLESFHPTILVGPPSVLLRIAQAIENDGLSIAPVKVISVAEVLEPHDENILRRAFSLDIIHQAYQSTEGFLGFSCEYGTMHLNEDIIHIEREHLSEGRFIPIITDFRRRTQPIVRYRLNDLLIASNIVCQCGSPFTTLERIEGRQDDIFVLTSRSGALVNVYPDMISRCMIYVDGIRQYRVTQDVDGLSVYADPLDRNIENKIMEEFNMLSQKLDMVLPPIVCKPYTFSGSTKLKRVERVVS